MPEIPKKVFVPPGPPPLSSQTDRLLAALVSMANTSHNEEWRFPVTLLIGGTIMSGLLIPGAVYYKKYGEQLQALTGIDGSGGIAQTYLEMGKQIYPEAEEVPENAAAKVSFIHLANAQIFTPGQRPSPDNGFSLWRARLSEVAGFALGGMASKSSD